MHPDRKPAKGDHQAELPQAIDDFGEKGAYLRLIFLHRTVRLSEAWSIADKKVVQDRQNHPANWASYLWGKDAGVSDGNGTGVSLGSGMGVFAGGGSGVFIGNGAAVSVASGESGVLVGELKTGSSLTVGSEFDVEIGLEAALVP